MFHLKGLFEDEDPELIDDKEFVTQDAAIRDPIFSMTYLSGTIRGGNIEGRWTAPGPSPTNSVLLLQKRSGIFRGRPKRSSASRIREPP